MNHQPRKPFLPSNPNAAAAAAASTSSNFRDSLSGLCLLDVADPLRVFSVSASDGKTGQVKEISYTSCRIIGNGSFGIVFYAKLVSSRPAQEVAIKRVLQDKRYKNRELQIMRELSHPNIVALHSFFYSSGEKNEDVYLNLVLDYMPETVHKTCRHYAKAKQFMPLILVKLYTYQVLQALAYLHSRGYCHRDIKPQNLLVNPQTGQLKLCDFGSAKRLSPDEANVSYICSRYYRAPELIFGATHYTNAVDIWSTGCVVAELMLGQPIFPGESGMDQLVEIIKVLGTPNKDQVRAMNPNYVEHTFPQIGPHPLAIVFRHKTPASAIQFISQLLQYAPQDRPTAHSALSHAFFDELRAPDCTLPNGASLPAGLFNDTTSVS